MNATAPASLLVKQPGSVAADTLEEGLRAAGLRHVVVANPYRAVTEAARTAAPVRHLIVGVDYYGPEEFRLFPLFRREWPDTLIAAYHSPGFEHKGRIARLVGADLVVSAPGDIQRFLASLRPEEPASQAPARFSSSAPLPPRDRQPPPRDAHVRPRPAEPGATASPPPEPQVSSAGARAPTDEPPEPPPPPAATPGPHTAGAPHESASPPTETAAPSPPHAEQPAAPEQPSPTEAPAAKHAASHGPVATPAEAATPPTRRSAQPAAGNGAEPGMPQPGDFENLDDDEELANARVLGMIELTDEELRLLLGEDEGT